MEKLKWRSIARCYGKWYALWPSILWTTSITHGLLEIAMTNVWFYHSFLKIILGQWPCNTPGKGKAHHDLMRGLLKPWLLAKLCENWVSKCWRRLVNQSDLNNVSQTLEMSAQKNFNTFARHTSPTSTHGGCWQAHKPLQQYLNEHFWPKQLKRIPCREGKPWFNSYLNDVRRNLRMSEITWRQAPSSTHLMNLRSMRGLYKKLFRASKTVFFREQLNNARNRLKKYLS